MTSVVLHPQHECAPHAIRTTAMAAAIALNLAALLIAMRPLPLVIPDALPFRPAIETTLLPQAVPLPQPPLPILHPVHRVTHAAPVRTLAHPVASDTPVTTAATMPVNTTPTPVSIPAATQDTPTDAAAGNHDASIAYETATPPAYPVEALRDGIEGSVLLRVLVDETGKPLQVLVVKSSGSRALDAAARDHVLAAWRFHPAQRDGHAIRAWAQVPVKFSLGNR